MRKIIALLAVAAMVAVLAVPVVALAAGSSEAPQAQMSYGEQFNGDSGKGDCEQLRDGSCSDCTAECNCDQTCTRTQTQTQTQTQAEIQDVVLGPVGAQVKAGTLEESSGAPDDDDEKPVAATVRAETQADGGFFDDLVAGLQRIAQRLMDLLGLA